MKIENIRNFSIIAHVDHGKSTLADRLMQETSTVKERDFQDQLLDDMDLEREKGITIKSHPVSMNYTANGTDYLLNLIDTPGHVDFAYEVSRSLAACEGALLIIDVAQGVQAQTIANVNLALEQGLKIVPIFNKIDLPSSNIAMCSTQLEDILAIPAEEAIQTSAKNGIGIKELLQAIIERIPPPTKQDDKLKALIIDSFYDAYRGVVNYVRIVSGQIKTREPIIMMASNREYETKEVGIFSPEMKKQESLTEGCVGYLIANVKNSSETKIGDTITGKLNPALKSLQGFKEVQPMVFSGIYPIDTVDYESLKYSMGKLQLNDPAFVFQAETSVALGFGFRCGFLGLLHMEITQERLRREYNMNIIATYPSVIYHMHLKNGKIQEIDNPVHMPDPTEIERIEEPIIEASIMIPNEYIGSLMNLIMEKRGVVKTTESTDDKNVMITADLPMHEVVIDFNDRLKSLSRGYGSMNYKPNGYQANKLVKLQIMVNGDPVDAFSTIVHKESAEARGRSLAKKLKAVIPQQMFVIAIQAAIGGKIIARETIRALRKNVTAKCYGGDITRKRKLLEKQKEGKKRMKQIGKVNIPQDAFIKILKSE